MTELGFNYYNRRFIGTKLFSHYSVANFDLVKDILQLLSCFYQIKQDFFAMTLSFVKVRDKLDSGIGNI